MRKKKSITRQMSTMQQSLQHNNTGKRKKLSIITFIPIIFIAIGAFMLLSNIHFMKNGEKVSAKITEIETYIDTTNDTRQIVYISYTYNGIEYDRIPLNTWSFTMSEGKTINVYCNQSNPTSVRAVSTNIVLATLLMVVGIICLIFL